MSCDCSPPRGAVSVDVCLGAGGRLSLLANGRAGVGALKTALAARVGIPASKMVLLHRDRVLSDSGTLADHQVGDGCKLRLLPRLTAGRDICLSISSSSRSDGRSGGRGSPHTTDRVIQGNAESTILFDAVNRLPPEAVEKFIQGQASLTIQQTMDDGRGLVVQFCLQPPQITAAAAIADLMGQSDPVFDSPVSSSSAAPSIAAAAVTTAPLPATALLTTGTEATCNNGNLCHRTAPTSCGGGLTPRPTYGGGILERMPLKELHDQDSRRKCLMQQSSSCGCEMVVEETKHIGMRDSAIQGSFSGSVCMHRVGYQDHVDRKKQIILTILTDIMKASRNIKDRVELDVVPAGNPIVQDAALSLPSPALNDEEAMRKKVDHVRQQMAVRRHRHKCRMQFRMMPYS